ncbi:MAG: PA14 domain-containing protein, partial [Pirellulales bacterium]
MADLTAAAGSMDNKFDPYRKWLGIAPKDQPPTNYRLLGIDLFEDDADVIANAADQRMAHLRTFQAGKHGDVSQRILGELSNAKLTLLNPERKAEYDAELRQQQAGVSPPPPAAQAPARPVVATPPPVDNGSGPAAPQIRTGGGAVATAMHASGPQASVQPQSVAAPIIQSPTGVSSRGGAVSAARARRKKNSATPIILTVGLVLLLLVIGGVMVSVMSSGSGNDAGAGTSDDRNRGGTTNTVNRPGGDDGRPKPPTFGDSTRTALRIGQIANQTVAPSEELELVVRADGSRLNYTLEEAPPGARLDPNSGVFRWRPLGKRPGESFYVTIRVRDQQDRSALSRFQVQVVEEERVEGGGLKAEFFADQNLARYVTERDDPNINFLWHKESPAPGVPADAFSVRWTGWLLAPQAGEYAFTAFADDGVRLWIGERLVLDDWQPGAARQVGETIPLAAGPHPIKLEYFDSYGDATIQLRWRRPDGVEEIVPSSAFRLEKPSGGGLDLPTPTMREDQGLTVELYGGGDLSKPIRTLTETDFDWTWGSDVGGKRPAEGPFAAKMTGQITAPREGTYTLLCEATGRLQVEIDGERILSMGTGTDGRNRDTAKVRLSEQPRRIQIALITGGGPGVFSLRWLRPGEDDETKSELIPPDFLRPRRSAEVTPQPTDPTPQLSPAELRARQLASGIFRFGGSILLAGHEQPIAAEGDLPPGAIEVAGVELASDAIGDRHLEAFLAFPGLQRLAVASENVTDEGLGFLAQLTQLRELELRTPQVTDAGARRLLELPQLSKLYLGSNAISDRVFVALKRMPALESLAISSDRLSGESINELRDLASLRQLTIISGGLRD